MTTKSHFRSSFQKNVEAPAPVNFLTLDGPKENNAKPDFSYLDVTIADGRITVEVLDETNQRIDTFEVDPSGNVIENGR